MTNILSFSLVKSEYHITYDRDAFIIHRAAKGYSDMVFKPHKCGLHVYDPDEPRGRYSFMETVENDVIEIPMQIMLGEVVHYKYCAMSFGWYCQIHEEDQPVWYSGRKVRFCLDPVGTPKGAIISSL